MAKGANSRKTQSATDGEGGERCRTSSYQPQIALPSPAIEAEAANSSQEPRRLPRTAQARSTQEIPAATATADRPRSPISSPSESPSSAPPGAEPQCSIAPTA